MKSSRENNDFNVDKLDINENTCDDFESKDENVEKNDEKSLDNLELVRDNYDKDNPNCKSAKKRLTKLYARRLMFIFLSALIFNFGVQVFLNRGETIPSGLSGIPQLITLSHPITKPYFALIYLGCNLPLLLGFGFKIKKSFSILTTFFMLFQIVTNFILVSIPIGKITPDQTKYIIDWLHENINFAPGWTKVINVGGKNLENPNTWPIFIYGAIGSACVAMGIVIAWKNGGSTGGTDIIAYYFSTKKQMSIGNILSIISVATTLTFLIIFGFVQPHNNYATIDYVNNTQIYKDSGIRTVFGMREFTTFFYIFIVNILINLTYPKYKKVSLEISSVTYPSSVLTYFRKINYWHAYTISEGTSGYTGKKTYTVVTTMLLLETRSIIRDLKALDPKLWISIKPVVSVSGDFNTKYIDSK
ncbi:YitT family protein [Mycoplasmopsis caviae]|uniref:Uncharacterized BCR, YitT family COG1284 n=1 Tax=Mycoplasmopsis caviae TaxID=55603 RepID=A0A3P8KA65_9BACT|nr:YitT family protein [Mycoplasmopsis caviae]UUD35660.1 YitT family protein [Mycoplasmopsis caviae]VDR41594.1 Uncharacterized BCR, YitT family COG1284 [Mycoplasmopsis caviae]